MNDLRDITQEAVRGANEDQRWLAKKHRWLTKFEKDFYLIDGGFCGKEEFEKLKRLFGSFFDDKEKIFKELERLAMPKDCGWEDTARVVKLSDIKKALCD